VSVQESTVAGTGTTLEQGEVFRIGAEALRRRTRNQAFGAVLSLLLAAVILWANGQQPETYNDVLMWSVLGFLLLLNSIGYARHRRYRRLVGQHLLRIADSEVHFETGDVRSVLRREDIATIRTFRRRGRISHIQIRRTDHRGIRLEDYDDMAGLADALKNMVLPAQWQGS
jgi:hypothetical protein